MLYGDTFAAFSATFNSMQSSGLDAATAAARVPSRSPSNSLRRSVCRSDRTPNNSMKAVREQTDEELDALSGAEVAGLDTQWPPRT